MNPDGVLSSSSFFFFFFFLIFSGKNQRKKSEGEGEIFFFLGSVWGLSVYLTEVVVTMCDHGREEAAEIEEENWKLEKKRKGEKNKKKVGKKG